MHSYSYIWYSETNIIFFKGRVQYNMKNKGFDLTLISFLWKPKSFFTNLKESPNIIAPFTIFFLLTFIPTIIVQINLQMNDISLFFRAIAVWFITNIGFLLISWGVITFLYRLLKIRNKAKVILSVLLYANLAEVYGDWLFNWIRQIRISLMGSEGGPYNHIFSFESLIVFGVLILFVGIGLKWSIPSTNKQLVIVLIGYTILNLLIFIALIVVVSMILSSLFQEIGEMLWEIISIFDKSN